MQITRRARTLPGFISSLSADYSAGIIAEIRHKINMPFAPRTLFSLPLIIAHGAVKQGVLKGFQPARLLLKSRETSNCSFLKIADLTIDEAYAHKYLETVSDVHHFKTSSWKDVKVSIYI